MHSSAGTLFGFNNNNSNSTTTAGAGAATAASTNPFGSSLFGATPATGTGTATLTSQPVFGNSLGGTSTATGTTAAAPGTGFGFGGTASTTTAAAPGTGLGFGATANTTTTTTASTGGFFGASTATSKPGGFGLGTTSTLGSGSMFGSTAAKPGGFGLGTTSTLGSGSMFGSTATKPGGFGTTTSSFGLSGANANVSQNPYPHLSVASNPTDTKYIQIYDTAFRAACDKNVKETTMVRDLPPKIQELCANLEKTQTEAISKRNQLVQSLITTAPCLKVGGDDTMDEDIFSIPDQLEEALTQFRQVRQNYLTDKNTIDQLSTTTTELLAEVKRLEQLVNRVKTQHSSTSDYRPDTEAIFKRQKGFTQFLSPNFNGFAQGGYSRTIASVHPVSKPTDFIEYFIELEKTHESKIEALNQQLLDIDTKTNSFLHYQSQSQPHTKTSDQQYEALLASALDQASQIQLKTTASQSRILELRKLAHNAGLPLNSLPVEPPSPSSTPTTPADPLDTLLFKHQPPSKVQPGWDDVLYEIATTELVPSDLTKAKPA